MDIISIPVACISNEAMHPVEMTVVYLLAVHLYINIVTPYREVM